MLSLHEQYLTNEKGQKKAVVLPFRQWKKILAIVEEYEAIRAYDRAKKRLRKSAPVSLAQVETRLARLKDGELSD